MKTIIGMPDPHEPFELPKATARHTGVRPRPSMVPLTVSRRKLDACRMDLTREAEKAMRQSTAQAFAFGIVCFITAAIIWFL